MTAVGQSILISVLLLLCCLSCRGTDGRTQQSLHKQPVDTRYTSRSPLPVVEILPLGDIVVNGVPRGQRRSLQTEGDNTTSAEETSSLGGVPMCSMCGAYPVLKDVVPEYSLDFGADNLTCEIFDGIVSEVEEDYSHQSACNFFQDIFSNQCCDFPPRYQCEKRARREILEDYDTSVVPIGARQRSLDVTLTLDFYHITELDVRSATVEIFVWIHLNWTDPQLAWDRRSNTTVTTPDGQEVDGDPHCATSVTARASLDAETSEIWVPDFDLYNQATGVQNLPEASAVVRPDGHVYWRRNGGIRALCFLEGLRKFPYDTLLCEFIFGGWTREPNVNFLLGGPNGNGFFPGEFLEGAIYTEFTLDQDRTEVFYSIPPTSSESYQNLVTYQFYFNRAQRYYVTKIIIPNIIFTLLSFGVFLLDLRVGERLTYGLTVLLVIIAQDIVTSTLLPISDERLWINVLLNGSFYWVLITLLESVFVMWLLFVNDDGSHSILGDGTLQEQKAKRLSAAAQGDADSSALNFPNIADAGAEEADTAEQGGAGREDYRKRFQQIWSQQVHGVLKSKDKRRYKLIRRVDTVCFFIVSISYFIFVTVMLATRGGQLWDDDNVARGSDGDLT